MDTTEPTPQPPITFDDLRKVAEKMDQAKIERPPLDIRANKATIAVLMADIPPAELDSDKPGLTLALLGGIPVLTDESMIDGQFKIRDRIYTVAMPEKKSMFGEFMNRILPPRPLFPK